MKNHNRPLIADGRFWFACIFLTVFVTIGLGQVHAQEPVLPDTPPNAGIGLEIYADRCANCHGPEGAGDGELAADLPAPPRALNNPEYLRTAVPADIFNQITNGNLEAGMPPFGPASSNPISETDRWNLVAAVYSLGTSPDAVTVGQVVYEENCTACHGETGLGDGPQAGDYPDADLTLTGLNYWYNRSNEAVRTDLSPGIIPEHALSLSEEEAWAVVDYARTFSYEFQDVAELAAPIPEATVSGFIINGTTNEPVTEGEVILRAFTVDFQQTLNMTTTVQANGRFDFSLTEVDPDWVFLTTTSYQDLNFSSNAGQVSLSEPMLELPITIFDTTTDSSAISYEQLHVIFNFAGDRIQVTELQIMNNEAPAVFVGETGDPEEGTIRINLPDSAENIIFERALGSMENSVPANDIIQTETGWADTLPVQPGQGSLNLIISYELPFEEGMTLSHPLPYDMNRATVIMPEIGVSVEGNNWEFQGSNTMPGGGGSFIGYAQTGRSAGETLAITLSGEPEAPGGPAGSATVSRNNTNELIIGVGVLLVVVAAAVFLIRNWQQEPVYETNTSPSPPTPDVPTKAEELVQEIAALDDAYEQGEVDEAKYQEQRHQLKQELKAIWNQ